MEVTEKVTNILEALKGLYPDAPCALHYQADYQLMIAVRLSAQCIVYVSCDPATLARDVKLLTARGYAFSQATAVDLFPRTKHVETVCLLSRVQGK